MSFETIPPEELIQKRLTAIGAAKRTILTQSVRKLTENLRTLGVGVVRLVRISDIQRWVCLHAQPISGISDNEDPPSLPESIVKRPAISHEAARELELS
jgi:hypothetical protein